MKSITLFYWVLIFCFTNSLPAFNSEKEVSLLLEQGKLAAEQGDFTQAINSFNQAMGFLRQASRSHPLLEEVQKQIRITKGRSLVQRYKNRGGLQSIEKNVLLSLREETEEVIVNQCFGSVLAREVWHPRELNRKGELFGLGRRITVLPSAGVDISIQNGFKFSLRSVEAASFALLENNVIDLHSGSFSLASLENNIRCTITSPLSEFVLESDDPFAIMLAVTTNGGLKVISLLGEIELKQKQKPSTSLRPGQLIFSLPDSFSRKMSVELSTLMVTSKLMTGFDEPPVFFKKLKQQALIQALRTKKRFKTVVGDAKTNSDFQIQVLEEK